MGKRSSGINAEYGGVVAVGGLVSPYIHTPSEFLVETALSTITSVARDPGVASMLFESGVVAHALDNLKCTATTSTTATTATAKTQSAVLKLLLLLAQSPENARTMRSSGAVVVLEQFAAATTQAPFKAASQRLIATLSS
eukprot:TRINITY_DN1867_c0_g1_i2.p2 TRINITY_DN1867_c0_g1~~TRINITY_DN1867_c0_g1_i2.p2  ORF type:complete len:140 (-),score=57.78 TRINITY_DN1867_c0_g1_i2:66-485(-)